MSELKAGVLVTPHNEGMCFHRSSAVIAVTEGETEFYLKSEADKVIAEKDAEIAELKKKSDLYKRGWEEADKNNAYLYAQLRHNKYKRCLGIAAVCFEKSYSTTLVKYDKESGYRLNFYDWWGKRWLELAEKFKPNSTAKYGKG